MIAETIQLSLVPAFLLVATGSFLNVVTGRLARVVDRARDLQQRYAETEGLEHERVVRELRRLDRRMDVINWSIALCVACAIVVCIMVAMLFAVGNGRNDLAYAVAAAFITAMLLLTAGLIAFLVEVRLAIQTIHVPLEMLEREGEEKKKRRVLPRLY
jgi:ABC-type transport system involved in cytochrome bd biosynthesis fused ATPase/permease subunit